MKINGNPDGGGSGDAIWGGITGNINSQTDLINKFNNYVTEEWVEGQDYVSDSAPFFPINQIKSPTGNQLFTNIQIPSQTIDGSTFGIDTVNQETTRYIYNVPTYLSDGTRYNELWYCGGNQQPYVFNADNLMFEKTAFMEAYPEKPLWRDHSGRLYLGDSYEYDPEAPDYNSLTAITLCPDGGYSYNSNIDNVVYTRDNVYLFDSNRVLKFDEENQVFESFSVTGSEYVEPAFGYYYFVYEGHYLYINEFSGTMYEFDEDNATISVVSTPYFDVQVNGSYIKGHMLKKLGSDYYYAEPNTKNVYKLNTAAGTWTLVSMNNKLSSNYSFEEYRPISVVEKKNEDDSWNYFCMGGYDPSNYGIIQYFNPTSETINLSKWQDPGLLCVDLKNNQVIEGHKQMQQITVDHLTLNNYIDGNEVGISINNLSGQITNMNLTGNIYTLNGKPIATTDKCILNRTYGPYGPYFTGLTETLGFQKNYNCHFKTYNGRLFKIYNNSVYEFNGSDWVESLTFTNIPMDFATNYKVASSSTATFMCRDGKTYMFDNSSTDFVYICEGEYELWTCGSTIRGGQNYKLVESGGTYSWVEDSLTDYKGYDAVICNSNVYVLSENQLYQYDESLKSYTALGQVNHNYPINVFVCNNEIFVNNGYVIVKVDFSLVGVEDVISVETNIQLAGNNTELFYCEYNNKMYCYGHNSNYFGYCYSLTEEVPEVPATNGTYVLKAVRTNSGVTYSWVLDEVAQAVQITNEILS